MFPKVASKAVLQTWRPNAAILQTCSSKRVPKAILQSDSRKLRPKVAKPTRESCFRKRLPKVFFNVFLKLLPKIVVLQGNYL
jgi:hypothetical protein